MPELDRQDRRRYLAIATLIIVGLLAVVVWQWRAQDRITEGQQQQQVIQSSASVAVSSAEKSASSVAQSAVNRGADVEAALQLMIQRCESPTRDTSDGELTAACEAAKAYLSATTRAPRPGITTPNIPPAVTVSVAGQTRTETAILERTTTSVRTQPPVTLPPAPRVTATVVNLSTETATPPAVTRTTTRPVTIMQTIIEQQTATRTVPVTTTETTDSLVVVTQPPETVTQTDTATETARVTETTTPPPVTVTATTTAPGPTVTTTAPTTVTELATVTETTTVAPGQQCPPINLGQACGGNPPSK